VIVVGAFALAWGLLVGLAILGWSPRLAATRRARDMAPRPTGRQVPARMSRVLRNRHLVVVGRVFGTPLRRRRAQRSADAVLAELPIAVDLVGVAIGAGCSPYRAVEVAARWSPARLAALLGDIGRTTALGASFDRALRDAGTDVPNVRRLTETLRTSARLGSPATAALARLSHEVRADVRRRAEARARTVPVRLLFPLVFCVLPAFALLTVVPVLLDGIPL
jgi:tight adherence protein C